jgi:hypothetical protein
VTGPDGEPLKLADVDFDIAEFLEAAEPEEPDDEADPPMLSSSPSGITPDSTSPDLSSVTG